jgi:hypothetical protein
MENHAQARDAINDDNIIRRVRMAKLFFCHPVIQNKNPKIKGNDMTVEMSTPSRIIDMNAKRMSARDIPTTVTASIGVKINGAIHASR